MVITPFLPTSRKFFADNCSEFYQDLANWPKCDINTLSPKTRARFERLCRGLELYFAERPMREVAKAAGVSPRRWYELMHRALASAPDGRIFGYRAFIKGKHTKPRERHADRKDTSHCKGGYSGLFSKLLRDRPEIEHAIVECISGRVQNKDGRWIKQVDRTELNIREAHRRFRKTICPQSGIKPDEYPLNTATQGFKAFKAWFDSVYKPKYASQWARLSGQMDLAKALDYQRGDGLSTALATVYGTWQVDAHRIDVRARYEIFDEHGNWTSVALDRFTVILAHSVGCGSNLGAKVIFAREPNAADIVSLIWAVLSGEQPRIGLLSDEKGGEMAMLGYAEGAGFPSEVIPTLRFATPEYIGLDNALAHLSDAVQSLLLHTTATTVILGKPGEPRDRGAIESKFSQLAMRVSRKLPGATGGHPRDPVRKKMPTVEKLIIANELDLVIDAFLRNQNCFPAAASGYVDPLTRLRRWVEQPIFKPKYLAVSKRFAHYFYPPIKVTIRAESRSPYFTWGVRYTSDLLRKSWSLVGKVMYLRIDPRNLQTGVLFYEDGREFGPVQASGGWGKRPHDLRIRKMYMHLKYLSQLGDRPEDAPLDALFARLNRGALNSPKDAVKLAYLVQYNQSQCGQSSLPAEANLAYRGIEQAKTLASAIALDRVPPSDMSAEAPVPALATDGANHSTSFLLATPILPRRMPK